jgi:hypothetical protein
MKKSEIKEYRVWQGMKARCYNKNSNSYKYYGEKGITVCDEWLNSFETFLKDMGNKPGLRYSIERINNLKGYSKENCKWALIQEQNSNKGNNVYIEVDGVKLTVAGWAKKLGVNHMALRNRLKKGWSEQDTIKIPIKKNPEIKYTKEVIMKLVEIGVKIEDIAYISGVEFNTIYRIIRENTPNEKDSEGCLILKRI